MKSFKLLLAAATIASTFAVNAGQVFTVDVGADGVNTNDADATNNSLSSGSNLLDVTQLDGSYSELVTITSFAPTGVNTFGGTFSTDIFLNITGMRDTNDDAYNLGETNLLGVNYGLYAMISFTGDFSADLNTDDFNFGNFDGRFDVFYDDIDFDFTNRVTEYDVTTNTLSQNSDDVLLASAETLTGTGNIGVASAFVLNTNDFALTTAGETFFTSPAPFWHLLTASGDLQGIVQGFSDFFTSLVEDPQNATRQFRLDKTASIQFVSEPSAIALLGLGLFGLGIAGRRRRK